jgi:hypothetical protein
MLLIDVFWGSRRHQILSYLSEACNSDSGTALSLHRASFDLFLIRVMKDDESLDEEVLGLFRLITDNSSSVLVVQQFVSLLALKKRTPLLKFLTSLVTHSCSAPATTFESGMRLKFRTAFDVAGRWVFSGWIYVDSGDRFDLFSIGEDFKVFIKDQILCCSSVFRFQNTNIPLKQWLLLTLVNSPPTVSITLNSGPEQQMSVDLARQGELEFLSGDRGTGKVGTFAFYPSLDPTNVRKICEAGPRIGLLPDCPFFVRFSATDMKEYKMLHTSEKILPFIDILLSICRIDLVLPVFSFSDAIPAAVEFLMAVLCIDSRQQEYFLKLDGFVLVSYLLIGVEVAL